MSDSEHCVSLWQKIAVRTERGSPLEMPRSARVGRSGPDKGATDSARDRRPEGRVPETRSIDPI